MNNIIILLLVVLSYLLGSFPSGYVIAKHIKKIDLTTYGSKHTGTTNTTRLLGIGYGLFTLFLDAIKGLIVPLILVIFNLEQFYIINGIDYLPLYGVVAALGHVFSIFLNFKGGKAVATSLGILVFIAIRLGAWQLIVIALGIFISVLLLTKYISLSSMLGSLFAIIAAIVYHINDPEFIPIVYLISLIILCSIILIKHKDNIVRLINGNENKFSFKRKT